jgi:hypothetical protein
VTGGVARTWAALTLRRDHEGAAVALLEWPRIGMATAERLKCPTVAAEMDILMAGTSDSEPARLEIADVIICQGRPRGYGPDGRVISAELRDAVTALGRWPGCLVAATGLDAGASLVAARSDRPVNMTLAEYDGDPDLCALLCAVFVYGWMSAKQRLAVLDGARVHLTQCAPAAGWLDLVHGGPLSLSLIASLCPASAGTDSSSCCTSAASSAPRSV